MFTVLSIGVLRLWNNKLELCLALIVPLIFFSIFALIFSRGIGGTASRSLRVDVVNESGADLASELMEQLASSDSLELELLQDGPTGGDLDELKAWARRRLLESESQLVLYIGRDFVHERSVNLEHIQLFAEGSDPIGPKLVAAILQGTLGQLAAASQRRPQRNPERGGPMTQEPPPAELSIPSAEFEAAVRGRQPRPVAPSLHEDKLFPVTFVDQWTQRQRSARITSARTSTAERATDDESQGIALTPEAVFGDEQESSKIAMYAAGIAVMFLLFSASGAGGSLLEEKEAGTLERLLSTQLSLTGLLAGKWLYIALLGAVQLGLMLVWAELVFGVKASEHAVACFVMTLVTSCASASLAILLAVLCRSRAQLNAVSIVLILSMSALGGSMVPRYLMSEELQRWGQWTFNAWAIDGFHKIFWQGLPLSELSRELSMLGAMAIAFGLAARLLARR